MTGATYIGVGPPTRDLNARNRWVFRARPQWPHLAPPKIGELNARECNSRRAPTDPRRVKTYARVKVLSKKLGPSGATGAGFKIYKSFIGLPNVWVAPPLCRWPQIKWGRSRSHRWDD